MDSRKRFEYVIQYTKAANKFFRTHEEVRNQYEETIRELLTGNHPEAPDIKRIRGKRNDYYRMRLGDYRVIYAVIHGRIVVIDTLLAGTRGDVYIKMGGLT